MILIFSDLHGNKEAAQSVEFMLRGFDEVLFCGDVCGYGKDFKYCIDMLRSNNIKSVLGNHDYMVLNREYDLSDIVPGVANPIKFTRQKIKQKELDYLAGLPIEIETESGIFIRHTLNRDEYIHTDEDARRLLPLTKCKIIAIGHTHILKKHKLGDVTVVNVGSISKGRNGCGPGYVMVDGNRIIERLIKKNEN